MWAAKYVTSAVVGETIPEAVKGKTFYDLQAPLPGSKGTFDFVSTSTLVDPWNSVERSSPPMTSGLLLTSNTNQ
jgi:hypothetical protein